MIQKNFVGWADLTNELYHSTPALGSSTIKKMQISPKHFRSAQLEGVETSASQQSRFDLGTCFHSVVLEQNTNGFRQGPDVSSKATKEWKEAKAQAEADKKILLSPDEYTGVVQGFDAFCAHPQAHKLVSMCQKIEASGFYTDEKTGLWLKCRPDGYAQDDKNGDFIFDYKTASSLDRRDLENSIARYGYHVSAAHYIAGVEKLTGRKIKDYLLCFQEVKAPYDVVMLLLDPEAIAHGKVVLDMCLLKIADCMDKNSWPGISDTIEGVGLPQWKYDSDGEFLTSESA